MVFCFQNCSYLLWKTNVLVIKKTFEIRGWRLRIWSYLRLLIINFSCKILNNNVIFFQNGVKSHFSQLELRQCQNCYQKNVKCKGAESMNDEETGKSTMTSYERIDGLCQPRSVYFSGKIHKT